MQRPGFRGPSEADVTSKAADIFHLKLRAGGSQREIPQLKPVAGFCQFFGHKSKHGFLERAGLRQVQTLALLLSGLMTFGMLFHCSELVFLSPKCT